jgi:hypothetical protein
MSDRFDDEPVDADFEEQGDDDQPRANQLVRRSFEGVATLMNNAATQALTAKATADINARWMIAMHRPRQLMDVRSDMLKECSRPKFAGSAIYAVPRGKTMIRGLSIRFAEAVMKAMGNMGAEAQTLYDSEEERTVRVTVTDFEGNTAWSRDLTIKKTKEIRFLKNGQKPIRQRTNSYGDTVYIVEATEDDVTTKEAAQISKASRTGILRLVPAWLLAECQERCEQTMANKAAIDPDAERRKVFDAFAGLNVKPSWLADWLGHPLEQATPAEIVLLQQLYRAIRDGETTLDDAMKARKSQSDKPKAEPQQSGVAAAAKPRPARVSKQEQATAADGPTPEEQAEIARLEREGK